MELFCALLTGFFLWLFLFHWHHAALARAREVAGALLIEVRVAGEAARRARWETIRSTLFTLAIFLLLCPAVFRDSRTLHFDFFVACLLCCFLEMVFPSFRKYALPLQLREHGVIRRKQSYENHPGRLIYIPWDEIAGCKWYDKLPERYVHTRHLLLERNGLTRAEVEAITAVAGRLVPVFDSDGKLLAGPESADDAADAVARQSGGRLRFQFNLQSLMLLTIVVSCGASCYGINYRRFQPQRDAVSKLEALYPGTTILFNNIKSLDFSACTTKPSDEDLVNLEPLGELENLNLTGASVTDAGLKHLYPLKKLRMVTVSNTQVTQKGVDDLKRALPNTYISWSPPRPVPVVRPPVGGK